MVRILANGEIVADDDPRVKQQKVGVVKKCVKKDQLLSTDILMIL